MRGDDLSLVSIDQLATRQRIDRLAESQVAESDVGHALQDRARGRRACFANAEKADRVFDRQVEHLRDVESTVIIRAPTPGTAGPRTPHTSW